MTDEVMTNFTAADMLGSKNDEPDKGQSQPAEASASQPKAETDPNTVPEGTSEEVLDWVGDSVTRARKALKVERGNSNPRETVTEPLQELLRKDRVEKRQAAAARKEAEKKKSKKKAGDDRDPAAGS